MRFQCPFCRGIVAVDNSDLGVDVQCGHCQEIVTVPFSRVATGAVIADFIILQELGRGGMGVVYLTHQISLDRPAALKVLAENYANNAEFVVGFIKEARAAAKLNHPHIVQAYAVGEDEGIFYFAMENIDGQTMKNVLKKEKIIPVDQAISIIQQIAEALDYAWKEQRLIHRDIKPDNIMLTSNGRAKLADLGLARVAGEIEDNEDDEVMGTPQYISPEHLTGAPMDIRSDIYSLGATFYHFVTGRFPFEGRTATEIARKHLEEKLCPPDELNPAIPESVSRIIVKMMAKDPRQRYQDAEQLVDDLRLVRRGKAPVSAANTTMLRGASGVRQASIGGQKKTLHIGSRKTGAFNVPVSTNTGPLTGPLSTTTTSIHSRTGVNDLKRLHEQQAKRKLIFIIALVVLGILSSAGAIIWSMKTKSKAPEKASPATAKTETVQPKPDAVPDVAPVQEEQPGVEPKSTAYTVKASEIMAFASKNPTLKDEIIKQCEDFFENFPPEPKYKCEEQKLSELLAVYVPLDEARLKPLRRNADAAWQSRAAELELKTKAALEEQRKKAQAEADRKKREAEAAKQQKLLKEQAQKELDEFNRKVAEDKASIRRRVIDVAARGDKSALSDVFAFAIAEEKAAATKTPEVQKLAKDYSAWADKLKKGMLFAVELNGMLENSTSEVADIQFNVGSDICKVREIKDGVINAVSIINNKPVSIKASAVQPKQLGVLVKKMAARLGKEDDLPYYFIMNADFQAAKGYAGDEDVKSEISAIATEYIRGKYKSADDAQKADLQKRFGKLDEYKAAVSEAPAPASR